MSTTLVAKVDSCALAVAEVQAALASVGFVDCVQVRPLGARAVQCIFEQAAQAEKAATQLANYQVGPGKWIVWAPLANRRQDKAKALAQAGQSARKRAKVELSVDLHHSPNFISVAPWSGVNDKVPGLFLIPEFCSSAEETEMMEKIYGRLAQGAENQWEASIHRRQPEKRRVQHYGYKFDYSIRRCDPDLPLGEFPNWINPVLERVNQAVAKWLLELYRVGVDPENAWKANQVTVNEYKSGQGIAPHVDTHSAFHDGIASLSLGALSTMKFAPGGDKSKQVDVLLPRRSLLIMAGPARFLFTHGIPQRKNDLVQDRIVPRDTRVSLTFRQIKLKPECQECRFVEMCDLLANVDKT